MLDIKQEDLTEELAEEAFAIFEDYYARSKAGEGMPPLKFKWVVYFNLQNIGLLRVYTAREDGKLLGVNFYVCMDHLHHDDFKVADCVGLSVHLDARGKSVGRKLVDFASEKLKAEGVHAQVHKAKTLYEDKPLFERLPGFTLIEKAYLRKLN